MKYDNKNANESRTGSRLVTGVMGGAIVVLGALLAASMVLLSPAEGEGEGHGAAGEAPAHVEPVAGSDVSRVTLTQRAAERIDLQTVPAAEVEVRGRPRLAIPYSALLYDAQGATWAYTSPERLVFERAEVEVDVIRGDHVLLNRGPAAGTPVVTVGAQELFGAEFGVGH